jgi:gas vesicle protein
MKDLEREEDRLDSHDNRPAGGHAFGAFVLGAAAGAAIALLYAPASGATTRNYLGRQARDGQRRANKVLTRGFDAFDSGRTRVASAVKEGRTRWQHVKGHAEGALEEGREAAIKIVEHGRQAAGEVKEGFDRIGAVAGSAGKRRR